MNYKYIGEGLTINKIFIDIYDESVIVRDINNNDYQYFFNIKGIHIDYIDDKKMVFIKCDHECKDDNHYHIIDFNLLSDISKSNIMKEISKYRDEKINNILR